MNERRLKFFPWFGFLTTNSVLTKFIRAYYTYLGCQTIAKLCKNFNENYSAFMSCKRFVGLTTLKSRTVLPPFAIHLNLLSNILRLAMCGEDRRAYYKIHRAKNGSKASIPIKKRFDVLDILLCLAQTVQSTISERAEYF